MDVYLPKLAEDSEVKWADLAAWVIRENDPSMTGGFAISYLLGSAAQLCRELNVSLDFSVALDGVFYVVDVDDESLAEEKDY